MRGFTSYRGHKLNKCAQYDIEIELESFLEKLKLSGKRITSQRKTMVLEILRFDTPFSAEELFFSLKKTDIDLATIYRSISVFIEMGVLIKVDFSDGVSRYEYSPDNGHHHHHHIVCTDCKSVERVKICLVEKQEKEIEKMGYSQVSHKLEFFGLCKSCST